MNPIALNPALRSGLTQHPSGLALIHRSLNCRDNPRLLECTFDHCPGLLTNLHYTDAQLQRPALLAPTTIWRVQLAKTPNFKQEKKQREMAQKKKNEQKQQEKASRKGETPEPPRP